MKQTHFLLLGLLFNSVLLNAQSNEIGIMLSQFYKANSNETHFSSSPQSSQNSKYHTISPYLTFTHIKKNQTIYSIQYAFVPYKSESNYSYGSEGSATQQNSHVIYTQNSHAFRLGIGKRNKWNQFSFSSMIYLPLEFGSKAHYKNSGTRADSANSIAYSTNSTTIYPNSFLFGLFISQSINYSITSKLKIGAEFNLGIQQDITRGKSYYTIYSEDHGNVVNDFKYEGKENRTLTYFNFIPAIAMSYSF